MDRKNLPISLVVVAVLFFIGGVFAVIEVLNSLMYGRININFGVLGLFIGPGLLRLSRGWRTCALVFIWIALIFAPIIALLFLAAEGPLVFNVFGQQAGHASKGAGLIMVAVAFVVAIWKYRVLTRLDVRRLFRVDGL